MYYETPLERLTSTDLYVKISLIFLNARPSGPHTSQEVSLRDLRCSRDLFISQSTDEIFPQVSMYQRDCLKRPWSLARWPKRLSNSQLARQGLNYLGWRREQEMSCCQATDLTVTLARWNAQLVSPESSNLFDLSYSILMWQVLGLHGHLPYPIL
jgi:hypothetical protein